MANLNQLDRRRWLQSAGMGMLGVSMSGWLPAIAKQLASDPRRQRHCILLWMGGGPSQTDTFDMKPDHENGGEFKEISTNVPGIRFSEHLPKLAQHADQLAIIRSLSTKEGDAVFKANNLAKTVCRDVTAKTGELVQQVLENHDVIRHTMIEE